MVLALGEGRFKSVAVELGRVSEQYAEIRAGLHEKDSVVISAQFLLDSESSKYSDFMRMHREDTVPAPAEGPAAQVHSGGGHD